MIGSIEVESEFCLTDTKKKEIEIIFKSQGFEVDEVPVNSVKVPLVDTQEMAGYAAILICSLSCKSGTTGFLLNFFKKFQVIAPPLDIAKDYARLNALVQRFRPTKSSSPYCGAITATSSTISEERMRQLVMAIPGTRDGYHLSIG